VLGHPFNPVHLIPLVEVGGGEESSAEAIEAALGFYATLDKITIRLSGEIFGHIANRLTSAMFREAVSLVANGVATVSDIDKAIQYGPALKWAIQGQFTTFHTSGGPGGLADFLPKFAPGIIQRWNSMADPDLANGPLQNRLIEQMHDAANGKSVEQIARHQDQYLMELLALLAKK
jgi:3-hydroxyacyl-CoA dehydrogenase